MSGVLQFVVGAWNYVVSIAPIVTHAICEVVNGAKNTLTL